MDDDQRFDNIIDSLSDADKEIFLLSCMDAIGPTGYGPNKHFGQGTEEKYKELGLSDDDVAVVEAEIEREKKGRQEVFWASQAIHMGEVPNEEGWGTRYCTEEDIVRAKKILGIEGEENVL